MSDELPEQARAEAERTAFVLSRLIDEVREHENGLHPIMWPDREDVYWCRRCDSYHRSDVPDSHRPAQPSR